MYSTRLALLNAHNGVGNGELASFGTKGLARIRAGVLPLGIGDGEHTVAGLVGDHPAARLVAHVTPIQAPVNERYREAGRAAVELERGAQAHNQLSDGRLSDLWLRLKCNLSSCLITMSM